MILTAFSINVLVRIFQNSFIMAKEGPLLIIEDDADDQEIYSDILTHMGIKNKLIFFSLAQAALDYLLNTKEQPFLILCDVNLPVMNGIEFKKNIDADPFLRQKSIPFIFFSTSAEKSEVKKAYTEMTVQGYFKKESKINEISKSLSVIMEYWKLCKHPNSD